MRRHRIVTFVIVFLLISVFSLTLAVAAPSARCFGETGFCISDDIRTYWEKNGALPVFGFPIGAAVQTTVDGKTITSQQFERARIEYHPYLAAPYTVQLGLLGGDVLAQTTGARIGQATARDAKDETGRAMASRKDCAWFNETQQYVCGDFYAYWRKYGVQLDNRIAITYAESLALFGLPISAVFSQTINGTAYQVQYFERARFEYHPENPVPYRVLTGLLGREVSATATTTTTPTPTATASTTTQALLPESDLATYRNNMPPFGYWNSPTNGEIVIAVSEMRYASQINGSTPAKRSKFVIGLFDIINNRASSGQLIRSNYRYFTIIDFEGNEYEPDLRTEQLNNWMQLKPIFPGGRFGGEIAFMIPDTTAVAQVKAYLTDGPPVTVELRVWPRLP